MSEPSNELHPIERTISAGCLSIHIAGPSRARHDFSDRHVVFESVFFMIGKEAGL